MILDSPRLCLQSEPVNLWENKSNTSKQPFLQYQWICFTVWNIHILIHIHTVSHFL